jgi:hypothetical protein
MVETRRGSSAEALPAFPPDSFDIVYIDGSHRYEDACFDMSQAKRLTRPGGVICGDDLELDGSSLPAAELEAAIATEDDYVFSSSAGVSFHPGVTGAVNREFPRVGAWNGFWAVRRAADGWAPLSLDVTGLSVPDHVRDAAGGARLIESVGSYNLVDTEGHYFAIDASIGPVDLFEEFLGERALPPALLENESLDALRREAQALSEARASAAAPAATGSPALAASYRGFNLVAYQGLTYALRDALGNVDVTDGEANLTRRFGPSDFFVAESADSARVRIDVIELSAELSAELAALAAETRSLREHEAKHETAQAGLAAELRRIHEDWKGAWEDSSRAAALRLDALEDVWRSGSAATADAVRELESAHEALSRERRLAARQLAFLQFGPGDPESFCAAGEHRGFALAHHRGRVYAARIAAAGADPEWPALAQQDESDDFLSGASLDGARARIDALEDSRARLFDMQTLAEECRAADERLRDSLTRMEKLLQTNTQALDRLRQSRLLRALGKF